MAARLHYYGSRGKSPAFRSLIVETSRFEIIATSVVIAGVDREVVTLICPIVIASEAFLGQDSTKLGNDLSV
jgi:hypothetical protein